VKNKKAHCRACSFGKKRLTVPQENQKDKEIERKSRKETNLQGGSFRANFVNPGKGSSF
jgi:hypothetical protein